MIELVQLRKEFHTASGLVTALDGINLTVPTGAVHGIVGPSGAGKSTLIRCLTLLERPTSGQVMIEGEDLAALPERQLRAQRHRIGMVFQHVNLFDARTALSNVAYPLRISGLSKAQATERGRELLELVGLADRANAYPAQLSGGQQQRVGIARALAAEPSVLLCDEPSSALDWQTTRQVLEVIRKVNQALGLTVLIITHEMAVVRQVCESVSLLANGRIVQSGPIGRVVTDYGSQLARDLIPLAASPVGSTRAQLEVSFSSANFSVRQVLRLLADLGADTAIEAGTIETLAGQRVGRFQLEVEPQALPRVIGQLRQAGLHVLTPDQKADPT
ncbi:MAG: ATP-binding cassette domain-containing protein [Bifidobacteriaceae bacterium]|nr:ATP-binding cassette domain-containing protein [Bifidobacteriaceae bacterium]